MVEIKWIKMFLFLFLGLQFTAVTEQTFLITVRDGDEATLSCENVMTDQNKCDSTTWLFIGSRNPETVALIKLGQIGENAKAKSDRLSVTANCSLVIKKVTVEDAGQYSCRQFDKSGRQQGQDSRVDLSVVSMTEHKDADDVKLNCSVSTYDGCRHTVKWLYEGRDWDINKKELQISQSTCSATVLLTSKYLQCEVTDLNSKEVQLYNFSPQLSGKKPEPETTRSTATQEAVTGQTSPYITVRDGDEATLSCENVMTDQDECDSTSWIFSGSRKTAAVELINLGQIGENAKAKSDRLSVTADCSLVIKKVTVEDAGYYTCKQYGKTRQKDQDSQVFLSVVSLTEHKDADKVKLSCSVSTYDECKYTVKWVYKGSDLDKNTRDVQMSQPTCSNTVSMLTSHFINTSKYLQCEVTDPYSRKVQLYNFNRQLSDVNATPTTTKPTIQSSSKEATTKTPAATDATAPPETSSIQVWWFLIFVVLAALIVAAAAVVAIRRKKTTGNNRQMIQGLSLNPAVTQSGLETSQDTVDPEEGVSYASISYTKKTNSKARVRGDDDDDDDDAVTYSTVKASSSSAGASTDPSNLYATVN